MTVEPVPAIADTRSIFERVVAVMAEIGGVPKDRSGPGVPYRFQGVADILAKAQPAMARHGMFIVPHEIVASAFHDRATAKGGLQIQADVHVHWRAYGALGDWLDFETLGHAFDTSDKAMSKALTSAEKYAFKLAFSIPEASEDQDAERPEAGRRLPQRAGPDGPDVDPYTGEVVPPAQPWESDRGFVWSTAARAKSRFAALSRPQGLEPAEVWAAAGLEAPVDEGTLRDAVMAALDAAGTRDDAEPAAPEPGSAPPPPADGDPMADGALL